MRPSLRSACLVALSFLALAACAPDRTFPSTPPTTAPSLATPFSDGPTAGICGEAQGDEARMTLEPGIPDPRCLIVTGGQLLRVMNRTGARVTVSLGRESYTLESDGEVVFSTPFGEALLPGVHLLGVDPCCGGELWLKGE